MTNEHDKYQMPNPYPAPKRTQDIVFSIAILILIALAFVAGRATAEDDAPNWGGQEQPLCRAVIASSLQEGITAPQWIGYPDGWEDIPPETFNQDPLMLYTDDTMTQGYAIYRLDDGSDLIVPHWSFRVSSSDDGAHRGTHDLCDLIRWSPPNNQMEAD